MSLPQLQQRWHQTKLIDTKKIVKFRPFTVGEQKKIMLIKNDNKRETDLYRAVVDMIQACVDRVQVEDLLPVVFEKLFYDIKSIADGNKIRFKKECPHCSKENEFDLDTQNDLELTNKNFEKKIHITENNQNIVIRFSQIKLKCLFIIEDKEYASEELKTLDAIAYCLESVADGEKVFADFSHDEAAHFIDEMPNDVFEQVASFYRDVPMLECKKAFECPSCKKTFTIPLDEVRSFLSSTQQA